MNVQPFNHTNPSPSRSHEGNAIPGSGVPMLDLNRIVQIQLMANNPPPVDNSIQDQLLEIRISSQPIPRIVIPPILAPDANTHEYRCISPRKSFMILAGVISVIGGIIFATVDESIGVGLIAAGVIILGCSCEMCRENCTPILNRRQMCPSLDA